MPTEMRGDCVDTGGARLRAGTYAVMLHYGYTEEQVWLAEKETHDSVGCEREGYEWNCCDDEGVSRHPIRDALERTAEILRIAFGVLDA